MGRPNIATGTKLATVRLSIGADQLAVLRREAIMQRTSISHVMRQAVDQFFVSKSSTASASTEQQAAD